MNTLPIEIRQIILRDTAIDPAIARFVCREWRDNIPKPTKKVTVVYLLESGYGVNVIKWAHESGCRLYYHSIGHYSVNEKVNILEYLLSVNVIHMTVHFIQSVAESGDLETLKWLHEKGCPWDVYTCRVAARRGHIECLKYARENGCPCDSGVCDSAAYGKQLDVLKYLHESGCKWDEDTAWTATYDPNIFKYVVENGCPIRKSAYQSIVNHPHLHYPEIVEIARQKLSEY